MKTNHDGTVTLNVYDTWTSCGACGQRVTGDSIHTCSPQLKELTDEEMTTFTTEDRLHVGETPLTNEQIDEILESLDVYIDTHAGVMQFVRAIERAHGIGE